MDIGNGITINPEHHFVLGFSGGKDSVASYLYLTRRLGLHHVSAIFCDTGHEATETYAYIDLLRAEHGFVVETVQPIMEDMRGEIGEEKLRERLHVAADVDVWKEPMTMESLCVLKRRFPSSMVRFCTEQLKLRPSKRWIDANCPDKAVTVRVSGVRAQESEARAKHPAWSADNYTGCMMWLPIHAWTHEDVFAIHREYGIPPNPLYLQGFSRVGCWPCIMARKDELVQLATRHPEAIAALSDMERRVAADVGKPAMSFFSNYKTPERFHSQLDPASGKTFPTADDVARWAKDEDTSGQQALPFTEDWTEDASTCVSKYGLCE